jgi:hypothetical protein
LFQSVATAGIQQQLPQVTKLVTAAGKPMVAATTTTATANLRMLGPAAGGLNLAHIGGKPVLLASKAQSTPIQGTAGQVIIYLRIISVFSGILRKSHTCLAVNVCE